MQIKRQTKRQTERNNGEKENGAKYNIMQEQFLFIQIETTKYGFNLLDKKTLFVLNKKLPSCSPHKFDKQILKLCLKI